MDKDFSRKRYQLGNGYNYSNGKTERDLSVIRLQQ